MILARVKMKFHNSTPLVEIIGKRSSHTTNKLVFGFRLAASLQDRIFNGHSNNSSSMEDEYCKNSAASLPPQLPPHSTAVSLQYEVKTEPGVHLKRSCSPSTVSKLPYKKQCTTSDYNEGNTRCPH